MASSEIDKETPSGAQDPEHAKVDQAPGRPGSKRLNLLIGATVLAVVVVAGVVYWLHSRHYESTDDAFIDSNQSQIASQINGRVIELLAADNQHRRQGPAHPAHRPARLSGQARTLGVKFCLSTFSSPLHQLYLLHDCD